MSGPFCKDCKHFIPAVHGSRFGINIPAKCGQSGVSEPVYGWVEYERCQDMRLEVWACGPDGALFEQAPEPAPAPLPWWRRVFS